MSASPQVSSMLYDPSLLERILALMQWPGPVVITALAALSWASNVVLQRRFSESRRRLMAAQFVALRNALGIGSALWGVGEGLAYAGAAPWVVITVGFLVLVAWLHTGLRVARVFVFQWLFVHSAGEGVPLLLIDLFTLAASLVLFSALLHAAFLIEVTSLLATSAVVSVVLGLALQDTLGHLFAGISLQLDRPFRLGDWVEVRHGSERISGQVLEISWRATSLLALGEELISVPNKTMAQGLVLNFSGRERPFVRGHLFRLPLDAPIDTVKALLTRAARETPGIAPLPAPVPLIIETTESWVAIKMINFITNYGDQYSIGDEFQSRALALLADHGIALATDRLRLEAPR